ncbi:MAG: glycosyltransferase family 4 protein [Bacteroidales bacterium]|nr:glycosyltransferase family 4 protein [Bacteroidales bacterium]
MNVLILSSKMPYPPRDGGAIATLNLAAGLAKNGVGVAMLAINTGKHYYAPEKIPETIRELIDFISVKKDTSLKFTAALRNLVFSKDPYIAERFFFVGFEEALIEILEHKSFDIIQLEGPYFSLYIPYIKKLTNARIILRAHNVEFQIWNQRWKNEKRIIHRLYMMNMAKRVKKLEKRILSEIDLLVPISSRDEKVFLSMNPGLASVVVPAGLDISKYRNVTSVTWNSIFFIGSLDWVPNQEGLQWFVKHVLPHLLDHDKDISVHIAGRNPSEEFINSIAHPSIIYHGEVEDAITFMGKYRVMAVPLLTGSGIRIKILEGMAMGKCIVTTSIGAEGIPVKDGEHLFIANDGKTFARKLLELLNDPVVAGSMSAAARQLIQKKFDTFAIASKLLNHYKNLI